MKEICKAFHFEIRFLNFLAYENKFALPSLISLKFVEFLSLSCAFLCVNQNQSLECSLW